MTTDDQRSAEPLRRLLPDEIVASGAYLEACMDAGLRARLKALSITLSELAKLGRVPAPTVYSVLGSGASNTLIWDKFVLYCEALDVDPIEVLAEGRTATRETEVASVVREMIDRRWDQR